MRAFPEWPRATKVRTAKAFRLRTTLHHEEFVASMILMAYEGRNYHASSGLQYLGPGSTNER